MNFQKAYKGSVTQPPAHTLLSSVIVPKSQKAKTRAIKEDEVHRDTCVQEARSMVDTARDCRLMVGEGQGRSPDFWWCSPLKGIRSRLPVH